MSWMMLRDIPFERRCRLVFSTFGFNRDNLCAVLQNKIYLAVLVRVISGFNIELAAKLLQNVDL